MFGNIVHCLNLLDFFFLSIGCDIVIIRFVKVEIHLSKVLKVLHFLLLLRHFVIRCLWIIFCLYFLELPLLTLECSNLIKLLDVLLIKENYLFLFRRLPRKTVVQVLIYLIIIFILMLVCFWLRLHHTLLFQKLSNGYHAIGALLLRLVHRLRAHLLVRRKHTSLRNLLRIVRVILTVFAFA